MVHPSQRITHRERPSSVPDGSADGTWFHDRPHSWRSARELWHHRELLLSLAWRDFG
jgi:hypothetical protein